MTEKLFKCWMVLDWKSGKFKVGSRKPNIIKPSQITIEINLTVVIPEQPQLKAEAKIVLSDTKVAEITIDAL